MIEFRESIVVVLLVREQPNLIMEKKIVINQKEISLKPLAFVSQTVYKCYFAKQEK